MKCQEIGHFSDDPKMAPLRRKLNVEITTYGFYPTFRRPLDVQPTSKFNGQRANLDV